MAKHRIAAAQTPEFCGNIEGALRHLVELSGQAFASGALLLCFPEGYLQGYLTDEKPAREAAIDISSDAFNGILDRLPESSPMLVFGLIEQQRNGRISTTQFGRTGAGKLDFGLFRQT